MRLVGSVEMVEEVWLGSHGCQLQFWRAISVAGRFSWEVLGLNPKLGSPAYSSRARKEPKSPPALKSNKVSVCEVEKIGDLESLLKSQPTKFCLQPLTRGSNREWAEWTRDASGQSGPGGSGVRTEGTAASIPVLSFPILQKPSFSGRALLARATYIFLFL